LRKGEFDEDDLLCGAHFPYDEKSAADLRASGEAPSPLHNNCSGKHAGMLLATRVMDVPSSRYIDADHPVQVLMRSTLADFAAVGVDFAARFRALDRSLGIMRALWRGEKVGEADLGPIWPAVLGGPPVMIGAWAGSTWIKRAAQEFDGWVASGARSNWGLLAKGIARFRELGGRHAVVTNVPVRLGDAESSPDGPDDPAILRCPRSVAIERLRRFRDLGFDDVVLVARRHDAEALAELRSLV
jgi:alkanesulfonate monooxygenase SsuD/methylene tetrahydromethanopterin reductase-like flavin-dependent oxidoreductase (luciferase family)